MENIKEIKIISPLCKIYDSDAVPEKSYDSFSMLKNEKKSFQIAVCAEQEADGELVLSTELKNLRLYTVEHLKSDLPMEKNNTDDYYRFSESGYYPDLLLQTDGRVHLKKGVNVFWVEADARENGTGNFSVQASVAGKTAAVDIEIIDAELDFRDFVYTCWFHTDSLMTYYGFEAFSDEYWRVTENFLRTAREYGMNCVLTPIFTPPLDTEVGKERPTVQLIDVTVKDGKYSFGFDRLTQWIEMAERCGIEYFELSHFYTQWGARCAPKIMATVDGEYKRIFGWDTKANSREYKSFLTALSSELKAYFEERNLRERVFIHVSDEPSKGVLFSYGKAARLIQRLFEGYKIIDALSDYLFYRLKIVTNPIPANNHIESFLGRVDNLWTYYCGGQNKDFVSNRFFCNCSLRTRVLGYQLFKFDIKGFLHWGYNFYFTQLSKRPIDPYKVTDAGGKFSSGDAFIVYPAKDGTANHSIRLKVFYDGLQDMAALNTLEGLTDKKTCLDIIEEGGRHNITFKEYPHDDEWLLETREAVNRRIKEKAAQ